jgi:hypothetical protein
MTVNSFTALPKSKKTLEGVYSFSLGFRKIVAVRQR